MGTGCSRTSERLNDGGGTAVEGPRRDRLDGVRETVASVGPVIQRSLGSRVPLLWPALRKPRQNRPNQHEGRVPEAYSALHSVERVVAVTGALPTQPGAGIGVAAQIL